MGFEDTWADATSDGSTPSEAPPDGDYTVALLDGSAFVSKKGNQVVKLELRALDNGAEGKEWAAIHTFATVGSTSATKATLARLGIDVDNITSFDELDDLLKEVSGRFYYVKVKRNAGSNGKVFENTYFEGEATQDNLAGVDLTVATAASGDDEIPFLWDECPSYEVSRSHASRW